MVPLGWVAGVIGLIIATIVSLNASVLIANLHEFGGKRHIRYRDLAGYIYGMSRKSQNYLRIDFMDHVYKFSVC